MEHLGAINKDIFPQELVERKIELKRVLMRAETILHMKATLLSSCWVCKYCFLGHMLKYVCDFSLLWSWTKWPITDLISLEVSHIYYYPDDLLQTIHLLWSVGEDPHAGQGLEGVFMEPRGEMLVDVQSAVSLSVLLPKRKEFRFWMKLALRMCLLVSCPVGYLVETMAKVTQNKTQT